MLVKLSNMKIASHCLLEYSWLGYNLHINGATDRDRHLRHPLIELLGSRKRSHHVMTQLQLLAIRILLLAMTRRDRLLFPVGNLAHFSQTASGRGEIVF